jgi:hypothetical protein
MKTIILTTLVLLTAACGITPEAKFADINQQEAEQKQRDRRISEQQQAELLTGLEQREAEQQARGKDEMARIMADAKAAAMQRSEKEFARRVQDAEVHQKAEEQQRRLGRLAADPAVAIPVVSAMICDLQDSNAERATDMQREKRLTAASGVVNLRERMGIAESAEAGREEIKKLDAVLSGFGANRVSCAALVPLFDCYNSDNACSDAVASQAELLRFGTELLSR